MRGKCRAWFVPLSSVTARNANDRAGRNSRVRAGSSRRKRASRSRIGNRCRNGWSSTSGRDPDRSGNGCETAAAAPAGPASPPRWPVGKNLAAHPAPAAARPRPRLRSRRRAPARRRAIRQVGAPAEIGACALIILRLVSSGTEGLAAPETSRVRPNPGSYAHRLGRPQQLDYKLCGDQAWIFWTTPISISSAP